MPPRVAICVASHRRPEGLFSLLGALDALVLEAPAPEIEIVVVDNDAHETARPVCDQARGWLRHPLRYRVEKRRGIPQARNAALAEALGRADWIAFVDDDEVPEPGWLAALLRTQRETGCDVVTGPALPRFAEPPPLWVAEGGFFDPPRAAQGAPVSTAFTNNLLVRAAALESLDALFDERFTLGVGEDAELVERLHARGHRIAWADDAVVWDGIPAARVSARWIVARGFRTGTARAAIDRGRGTASAPRIALRAGTSVAKGALRALAGSLRGRAAVVGGLARAAYGVGQWAGLAGVR